MTRSEAGGKTEGCVYTIDNAGSLAGPLKPRVEMFLGWNKTISLQ